MTADCLTLPPLPVFSLLQPGRKGAKSKKAGRGLLPDHLEAQLSDIARAAIRVGVDPIVDLPSNVTPTKAAVVMADTFNAFRQHRREIWPLILGYISKHPLVVLQMLREMSELANATGSQVPLPALNDEEPDGRSLVRLRAALRTYELTLHTFVSSIPRAVAALARGAPPDFADASSLESFLMRVDAATARLEFGVLVGLRLLERKRRSLGPRFELASEYAQSGADEQHVLLRSAVRSIVGSAPEEVDTSRENQDSDPATPPEGLFADWVRAVLAA